MQLQVGQKENVFDGQSHSDVKVHLFHRCSGQTGLWTDAKTGVFLFTAGKRSKHGGDLAMKSLRP